MKIKSFPVTMVFLCAVWGAPAMPASISAQPDLAITDAAAAIRKNASQHRVIVIGEFHGTREIPALVGALVESYPLDAIIRIGYELPRAQQQAIDSWIDGGDRTVALEAMFAADRGWLRPPESNDHRRNVDLLALFDRLRQLKAAGRDVAVVAFDVDGSVGESAARDIAMANELRRGIENLPAAYWIVVTGNVHAMKFKPAYCPQCQPPLTYHLADLRPYTVEVSAGSGAFVGCIENSPCGPVPMSRDPALGGRVRSSDVPFDYRIILPQFTPTKLPELVE